MAQEHVDTESKERDTLTDSEIEEFIESGVLVVPNVISSQEIDLLVKNLNKTLLNDYNIDESNLIKTGNNLSYLSSTHGAGGIIDLFYCDWKLSISTDERIFNIISKLWESTYATYDEKKHSPNNHLFYHPFGKFDYKTGYIYMNRVCFRIPDYISKQCVKNNNNKNGNKKINKKRGLQRCLAPHLDCCPND